MKAIIVGIDSLLGGALGEAIGAAGNVVHGTSRRPGSAKGVQHLDLADPLAGEATLPDADIAFFCAAMARLQTAAPPRPSHIRSMCRRLRRSHGAS